MCWGAPGEHKERYSGLTVQRRYEETANPKDPLPGGARGGFEIKLPIS
jgi:hypothetical protein